MGVTMQQVPRAIDRRGSLLVRRSSTEASQSGRLGHVVSTYLTAVWPVAGRGGPHLRWGHHAAGAAGERQAGLPAGEAQHHCGRRRGGRGDLQQQRGLAAAGQHSGGRAQRGQRARSATCLCQAQADAMRGIRTEEETADCGLGTAVCYRRLIGRVLWDLPYMSSQPCLYAGQEMLS